MEIKGCCFLTHFLKPVQTKIIRSNNFLQPWFNGKSSSTLLTPWWTTFVWKFPVGCVLSVPYWTISPSLHLQTLHNGKLKMSPVATFWKGARMCMLCTCRGVCFQSLFSAHHTKRGHYQNFDLVRTSLNFKLGVEGVLCSALMKSIQLLSFGKAIVESQQWNGTWCRMSLVVIHPPFTLTPHY